MLAEQIILHWLWKVIKQGVILDYICILWVAKNVTFLTLVLNKIILLIDQILWGLNLAYAGIIYLAQANP